MYLLDGTIKRGSDSAGSPQSQKGSPGPQGGSFGNGMDGINPSGQNGKQETSIERLIRKSKENVARRQQVQGNDNIVNQNLGDVSPMGDADEEIENQGAFSKAIDPFHNQPQPAQTQSQQQSIQKRPGIIDRAREFQKNYGKAKSDASTKSTEQVGSKFLRDKNIFRDGGQANRERVKQQAREKTEDYLKDRISKKIGNEMFSKGLQRGAGKAAREGAQKVAKKAVKKGMQTATKAGVKAGVKVGTQTATKGAQALITAAGVGSSVETFGLGLVVSFLLNVAISLGINDAIDAMFELGEGNFKRARFLAIRAGVSVGMFIWLLIVMGAVFSFAGIIFGIPLLIALNIYMAIGLLFPEFAYFQGLSKWWMKLIVFLLDVYTTMIVTTILAAIFWYICGSWGVGSGSVSDWIGWFISKTPAGQFIQWISGIDYDSISKFCGAILGV